MRTWRFATKDELIEAIRVVLERFPGVDYAFTQPIEMRVSEMLTGVRGDLAVKIFGGDQDELNRIAEDIVGVLDGHRPAPQDVYTPRNDGAQYLNLTVDRLEAGSARHRCRCAGGGAARPGGGAAGRHRLPRGQAPTAGGARRRSRCAPRRRASAACSWRCRTGARCRSPIWCRWSASKARWPLA
jgi:hypothetical protein